MAARPVKVNSVSLLSAKLLDRWTMLADGCPDCQVPLLRQRPTDTAALCVNCDSRYANGVRIMTPEAATNGRQLLPPIASPDANGGPSNADVRTWPEAVNPPGSSSAGAGGLLASVQHAADSRLAGMRDRHAPPPVPRAVPPTALRPHDDSRSVVASLSQIDAGIKREDAAAQGFVGVGHAGRAHAAEHGAADGQADSAAQGPNGESSPFFGAAEHPLPRLFPRRAAAIVIEPGGPSARPTSSGEPADDAAGGDDYSPTSDPRLGPFARPQADRAPSTPDRRDAQLSSAGASPASAEADAGLVAAAPDGHAYAQNGLAQPEARPSDEGVDGILTPPPRRTAVAPPAGQAESDRISAALGARLLQGWAMLDSYCPRCSTPLMRSRQGVLHCVGCRLDVRHEAPGTDNASVAANDDNVQPDAAIASADASPQSTPGGAGDSDDGAHPSNSSGALLARVKEAGTQPQLPASSDAGAGPSTAVNEQTAQRASSAPAAAAAKPVKRLHSPTEEASQKLQRRGSGGPAIGTPVGVATAASEPPRLPIQPRPLPAAGGGRSDGLPAPTVNGVPASLAGDVGESTGQLGLGHTAEDVQAMFTAAVLASTPPGSVAVGQPADGSTDRDRFRRMSGSGGLHGMRRQDLRLSNDTPASLALQQERLTGLQPAAVLERVTQTLLTKMLEVERRLAACADPEDCVRLAATLGDLAQTLPRLRAALA